MQRGLGLRPKRRLKRLLTSRKRTRKQHHKRIAIECKTILQTGGLCQDPRLFRQDRLKESQVDRHIPIVHRLSHRTLNLRATEEAIGIRADVHQTPAGTGSHKTKYTATPGLRTTIATRKSVKNGILMVGMAYIEGHALRYHLMIL